MIRANMAEPMWRQVPRALGWMLNYLFTGTLFRVYRASLSVRPRADARSRCCWSGGSSLSGLGGWLIALAGDAVCRRAARVRRRRRHRGGARSASSCCVRWPTVVRGADQQPLAVSAGIRARRAVLLGPLHRGRRASPRRDRASQRRRRDRRGRPQRRRRDRAGGGGARARARSRCSAATARASCC